MDDDDDDDGKKTVNQQITGAATHLPPSPVT